MAIAQTQVSFRQVLRHRDYRWLWLGQGISSFGDSFTRLGIPIAVYQLTGSKLHLGLAALSGTLASVVFSLLGGALVDRWDRRRTMLWADIIRGAIVLAIPLVLASPMPLGTRLAAIYAMQFFHAGLGRVFLPAKVSLLPQLVGRDELLAANSLELATMTAIEFLGYTVAGAFVQALGVRNAFLVDSASFWISALSIFAIRYRPPAEAARRPSRSVLADIGMGFGFVAGRSRLRILMGLSFVAPTVLGLVNPLMLPFVLERLNSNSLGYGIFVAVLMLGAALGSLLAGRWGGRLSPHRLLALAVGGMGALMALTFLSPALIPWDVALGFAEGFTARLLVAVGLQFVGAVFYGGTFVGLRTSVQQDAPAEFIGRVWSLTNVASSLGMSLGAGLAGLGEVMDFQILLVGGAVLLAGSGAAAWAAFGRVATSQTSEAFETSQV